MARKILLADDSVTAQNMGRKILADAGYEVLTVNNGSAALKKIAEAKPELIVLDVYMPGYSGLEVCQRLKEAQETARIPILLTVGKLEPFKPEEAKRVRADAFIVKPFEASELLSALSKLEDKMVPRSESSKPGRFARANAAIEQAAYDKTVSIDEDSGWKSRISFPTKKKKDKEKEEAAADDPAIYNPVNKDLRTVVDHKPAAQPAVPASEKVNLQALAPEGLPKDVTPEEIAALAAAAAQVKGTLAEAKGEAAEPGPADAVAKVQESQPAEPISAESKDAQASPSLPAPEAVAPASAEIPAEPKPEKSEPEVASLVPPTPLEVMDAIVALERQNLDSIGPNSGNGSGQVSADEPATMAVAAAAGANSTTSRWTAVAVALAADEVSVSLETEMERAQAAVAAAAAERAAAVSESKPEVAAAEPVIAAAREVAPEPPVLPVEESKQVEPAVEAAAPTEIEKVADAVSTDAIKAAVQELEAVAAAYEAERQESPTLAPTETPVEASTEAPKSPEPQVVQEVAAQAAPGEEIRTETAPGPVVAFEETKPAEEAPVVEPAAAAVEQPSPTAEDAPKVDSAELPQEVQDAVINEVAAQLSQAEAIAGISRDVATKESEIAETTAVAWANWRKSREGGVPQNVSQKSDDRDAAAMAAAAGAEKAPEGTSAAEGESGDIANIVDSVLADLRPKIVEEISRKLGKKK